MTTIDCNVVDELISEASELRAFEKLGDKPKQTQKSTTSLCSQEPWWFKCFLSLLAIVTKNVNPSFF